LLFDYDEYSPGIKVQTQDELIKALISKDNYKKERQKIQELFFDDTNQCASKKIYDTIIVD
jgi:CDP-glycerol glycerophosphotransferase (TagB/SpsB family)